MNDYLLISLAFLFIILWPNTIKLAKATRAEYFYWDFLIATFFISLIFSFVIGFSPAFEFPSFAQSFIHQFRFVLRAIIAGLLLNLAYFLFITSSFLVGISYSIIASFSIAMATEGVITILLNPHGFPKTILLAIMFYLFATIFSNISCKKNTEKSYRSKKAITLCTISGVLFGFFFPLLGKSLAYQTGTTRLAPHVAIFFFICGFIICNIFLSILFRNRPLISPPFSLKGYFQTSFKNHIHGFIGGVFWMLAVICRLFTNVQKAFTYAFFISHIYPLVIALMGVFFWKEYKKHPNTYKFLMIAYIFFSIGGYFLSFEKWTIP